MDSILNRDHYGLFPFGPKTRERIVPDVIQNLQKIDGCYIEYPPAITLPTNLDLTNVPVAQTDIELVQTCLKTLVSYLNGPVVVDRFGTDDQARNNWRTQMDNKYGKFFSDINNAGKLKREKIGDALMALSGLTAPVKEHGLNLGGYLGISPEAIAEIRQKTVAQLTSSGEPATDPYSALDTDEKLLIVNEVVQLSRQAVQKFIPLDENQGNLSHRTEQVAKIFSYLQEITPYEISQALEIRNKLKQLGLVIGPNCMDGWKWFPNTWPSKDPENKGRDILRMILDASFKFLPKHLQEYFHTNWCFNPGYLDGAEAGIGPPNKAILEARSDKQIILGLIASNAFDFHVELASHTLKTPEEKEEYIDYWLKLKELVTKLGIKPSQITDHLGFLDSKNIKQAMETQQPYNFEQVLLSSSPTKAMLALGQAKEQVERLQARGSKYLTIHGTPLLTPLDTGGLLHLKNRLQALVQFAESHNVHICLEIQGETKEQIELLLKAIPQLKITWDIAHIYLQDQTFNKPGQPQTHLTNENFFDYLNRDRIGVLHLGQPTLAPDKTGAIVPQDSHHPLFSKQGLIPQDFLGRMFKAVQKYNQSDSLDKIHAIFESPLKLNDYDTILKMVESPLTES